MKKHINLSELSKGKRARVLLTQGDAALKQRFEDLGISQGTEILCVMKSPLGDPVAYLIRGALIAIRKEDASNILVEQYEEAERWV